MSSDKKKKGKSAPEIRNRKASYEYHFIETWVAGIELKGTEVKSLRDGKVQMADAYCHFVGNSLFLKGMHISEYTEGSYNNHDATRPRRLLLRKDELLKIRKGLQEKGLTVIPVKIFFGERGFAKILIALAQGKKLYDKRDSIKERDVKRDMERNS